MTNADIATKLVAENLPAQVWAQACKNAVLYLDFAMLNRLLPNVEFSVESAELNKKVIIGVCADGSRAVWAVGLAS